MHVSVLHRRMSESQNHELENAVLERCHPHGAVVHVWVDKKSPYVSSYTCIHGNIIHVNVNTTPVLKAGHPVSYSFVACLFVSLDRVSFSSFLSVC